MSQFVKPTCNILFFTDYHFLAGGITDGRGIATILTQGATLVLRDLFFPGQGDVGTQHRALEDVVARRFSQLDAEEAATAGTALVRNMPHLALVESPPVLGEMSVEDHADNGTIDVGDGIMEFRPAGRLYIRHVSDHRVAFLVGSESLAGLVRPDPTLQAVAMDANGIHVLLHVTHPACGVCGSCGLCVICAEINYGVAGAAAASAIALMDIPQPHLPRFVSDNPAPAASPGETGLRPRAELAAELRSRLRPLLDIPGLVSGSAGKEG